MGLNSSRQLTNLSCLTRQPCIAFFSRRSFFFFCNKAKHIGSKVLLRGLLGTIFRCLMLLFFLRSHFHVGPHLPQCTTVFSSSKWKHIITTAVRLFLEKKIIFHLKNQQCQQAFCGALMPIHLSFQRRPFAFVAHPSVSCSTLSRKNLEYTGNSKHGKKNKNKNPKTQFAQYQNASHLWHEAEQLLASELQHYTTVNERK